MSDENTVSLAAQIAPSFYLPYNLIDQELYDDFWFKGGRGSTKSSFITLMIMAGLEEDPQANCLALRKVSDTIRQSIHANFIWAAEKLNVLHNWETKVSPAEFIHKKTGQMILFKGADKPVKLKSLKIKQGYIKYLWFEELAEFNSAEEIRNIKQSAFRGDGSGEESNAGKFQVSLASYNPPDDPHSWVNKEAEIKLKGRYIHHSDYRMVNPLWLGKRFCAEAEQLKKVNYDKYRHEYLGEVLGNTEKIIFAGKWREQAFSSQDVVKLDGPYFGADWGFSNDPNVICKLWIDWENHDIYVEYAQYGEKTELRDLPELFDAVEGAKDSVIRADSARPETISHMQKYEREIVTYEGDKEKREITKPYKNVVGCKKWSGCVEDGVTWMRDFTWIFHPRCERAIEEAKFYSYKVNRGGDVLAQVEDAYNHFWDSARYALEPFIKKRVSGEVVIGPTTTGGHLGEVVV